MLNETTRQDPFLDSSSASTQHSLIQHWLGIKGFPRRYADYLSTDGFTGMNMISTVGFVPARALDDSILHQHLDYT
jgi:heme/copper-type cytochrome/quinol oxidase subunit 1